MTEIYKTSDEPLVSDIGNLKFRDIIPWETTDVIGICMTHNITESGKYYHEIIGHSKGYAIFGNDRRFMFTLGEN